jgi:hypothetical protein
VHPSILCVRKNSGRTEKKKKNYKEIIMKINTKIFLVTASLLHIAAYSSEVSYDQARYNVLKNAYNSEQKWFKEGFRSQPQDIEMVKLHISKELQPQLDNMLSIFTKIKRVFFAMLTTSFGLPAGLSGLATVGGAVATPFALKENALSIPREIKGMWSYIPSAIQAMVQRFTTPTYSDLLKHMYFNVLPAELSGVSPEPQQPSDFSNIEGWRNFIGYHMREEFLHQLRPLDSPKDFAIILGLFAPIAGFAALTFGIIAKFLWNKARSYQKEIDNLKAQINLDNDMITALQGMSAK